MFLPHTYHNEVLKEDESSHLLHTFEGAVVAVLGVIVLIASNRAMKRSQAKKRG